jgi:hypothetical protein
MSKEMTIDKMVDDVFIKDLNDDLIDEITEERNFILNTLKSFIDTDEVWQQMVDNKEARKLFLNNMQVLFLQEMENSALIELATIKNEEE